MPNVAIEFSVQDLIVAFMTFGMDHGVRSFPRFPCRAWHEFLHESRKRLGPRIPWMMGNIQFNWNDSHPRIREASELAFALSYLVRPVDGDLGVRVVLQDHAGKVFPADFTEFAPEMLAVAKEIPGFLEFEDGWPSSS